MLDVSVAVVAPFNVGRLGSRGDTGERISLDEKRHSLRRSDGARVEDGLFGGCEAAVKVTS